MPRGAMEMVLDGAGLEYSPAQNGLSTGRSCSRGWRGTGQDGETGDVGKVGSERAEEPGPALGSPGEPWGALGFVWDTAPGRGGAGCQSASATHRHQAEKEERQTLRAGPAPRGLHPSSSPVPSDRAATNPVATCVYLNLS